MWKYSEYSDAKILHYKLEEIYTSGGLVINFSHTKQTIELN